MKQQAIASPIISTAPRLTQKGNGYGAYSRLSAAIAAAKESPQPLHSHHREHLKQEGFPKKQIDSFHKQGLIWSVEQEETLELGFSVKGSDQKRHSSSGLIMVFSPDFAQLRCDQPLQHSNGKLAKYLTPVGASSQVMLPDGATWVTEGWKDAQAGTLRGGIPMGAIAGVSHYRKALSRGCKINFLYDADGWSNPSVMYNLIRAALWTDGKVQLVPESSKYPKAGLCEFFKERGNKRAAYKDLLEAAMAPKEMLFQWLKRFQAIPETKRSYGLKVILKLSVDLLDDIEQDVLQKELSRAGRFPIGRVRKEFKKVLKRRERLQRQAMQPNGSQPLALAPEDLTESRIALMLADELRTILGWNAETQSWYQYADGIWSELDSASLQRRIQGELDGRGAEGLYSARFVRGTMELLKGYLSLSSWQESTDYLPFQNGVLHLRTRQFEPHAPGFRLTWQLPYSYDAQAECPNIRAWMLEAQEGDEQKCQLLRACLNAILLGRVDLQRFLEVLGPAATGKSTYCRLAQALVGAENTVTTNLNQLEQNRFETARFYRKRLIVIADSDRYGGQVSTLKAITGQDPLRYEKKNQNTCKSFTASGLVIITANEAIQSNDYTSGLQRRRLTIPFTRQIAPEKQRNLITIDSNGVGGEFVSELPGLVNWVLAMDDEMVTALVKQTHEHVPSLRQYQAQSLIETNGVADWLDHNVVVMAEQAVNIGTNQPEQAEKWLYPNYVKYSKAAGTQPLSIKRFRTALKDLVINQLQLPVHFERNAQGSQCIGLRLRKKTHQRLLRPVTEGDNAVRGF